jgi:hypothetical protein
MQADDVIDEDYFKYRMVRSLRLLSLSVQAALRWTDVQIISVVFFGFVKKGCFWNFCGRRSQPDHLVD